MLAQTETALYCRPYREPGIGQSHVASLQIVGILFQGNLVIVLSVLGPAAHIALDEGVFAKLHVLDDVHKLMEKERQLHSGAWTFTAGNEDRIDEGNCFHRSKVERYRDCLRFELSVKRGILNERHGRDPRNIEDARFKERTD